MKMVPVKWMGSLPLMALTLTIGSGGGDVFAQDVLPKPEPAFHGTIGKTYKDSKPDFPKPLQAPAGAPNVLIVLLDDVGFGHAGTFGGAVATPTLDRLAKDEPGIMLDLEAVSLIDSSGLGALVSLANQVGERDGQLGLLCPQQSLRRVFEITGLRRAFTFGTTFDELTAAMDRTREGTSNPA